MELLEKATQRDPNFALAYCALAKAHDDLFDSNEPRKHLELAKKAAETALQLRPDLAEAHLELARYYFYPGCFSDNFDRARDELTIVRRKLPNNSQRLRSRAVIDSHQNRWDASIAKLQKAMELDPRNGEVAAHLGYVYLKTTATTSPTAHNKGGGERA